MKATQILAAAAAALLTLSSAVATAKPKTAMPLMRNAFTLKDKAPKASRGKAKRSDCVNLEGSWKGMCEYSDGSPDEDQVVIDQYACDDVEVWGNNFSSGGATELGWATAQDYWSGVAFPDWNAAGNVFRLKVSFAGRDLGADSFYYMGHADEDFQLVNGQLVIRTVQTADVDIGGTHTQSQYWSTCTYDKLPESR